MRGKSASAPAAPLLALAGARSAMKSAAHGVSRSSPDTPLSDRLSTSRTETMSASAGSRPGIAGAGLASPAGAAGGICAGAGSAGGVAELASFSASGSLSERSINLCFPSSGASSLGCGAAPSPLFLAAASGSAAAAPGAVEGPGDSRTAVLGPSLAFQDRRGKPCTRLMSLA